MFISIAHAAGEAGAMAPSTADAFWTNMGLIGVMFVLFYFLMIRPQQKRMQKQRDMLDELKKGDKVVTGGGLYGTVSKIVSDEAVEVDLGTTKVVAMRYTIQSRMDDDAEIELPKAEKEVAKKAPAKKATAAKKTTTTKKTAPKKAAAKKTTTKKKA